MEKVDMLRSEADREERALYRMTLLETRVRELECIVHRLLQDRVRPETADAWFDLACDAHSYVPDVSVLDGLGRDVAAEFDRGGERSRRLHD